MLEGSAALAAARRDRPFQDRCSWRRPAPALPCRRCRCRALSPAPTRPPDASTSATCGSPSTRRGHPGRGAGCRRRCPARIRSRSDTESASPTARRRCPVSAVSTHSPPPLPSPAALRSVHALPIRVRPIRMGRAHRPACAPPGDTSRERTRGWCASARALRHLIVSPVAVTSRFAARGVVVWLVRFPPGAPGRRARVAAVLHDLRAPPHVSVVSIAEDDSVDGAVAVDLRDDPRSAARRRAPLLSAGQAVLVHDYDLPEIRHRPFLLRVRGGGPTLARCPPGE